MDRPTTLKKDWVLTQDAFDALLARLDRDPHRAGQTYEDIRRALITFFECRGSTSPEDQADETINRAARRLVEGQEIYTDSPAAYFYGIARNVLREHRDVLSRGASLESVPPALLSNGVGHLEDANGARELKEQQLECLERCLSTLSTKERELITGYYHGEARAKIQNRKQLANRLGIAVNALRIRALRIREKLEACVEHCVGRRAVG